jgi:hypothetical protein
MTISSLRSRNILQRAGTRLDAPELHNNDLDDQQPNHQPDHTRQAVVEHQEADHKGGVAPISLTNLRQLEGPVEAVARERDFPVRIRCSRSLLTSSSPAT